MTNSHLLFNHPALTVLLSKLLCNLAIFPKFRKKINGVQRPHYYSVCNIVNRFVTAGSIIKLRTIDLSTAFDKVNNYALYIKIIKSCIQVKLLELLEN